LTDSRQNLETIIVGKIMVFGVQFVK